MEDTLVYRHRRLSDNMVFYIGIGNIRRAYRKDGRSRLWNSIVSKHNYIVEILQTNLSWEDACELEIFLIELYGRIDLGTGILANHTEGGDGAKGRIVTDSFRTKLRLANTGKKLSKEHKLKISTSNTGKSMLETTKQALIRSTSKKVIDTKTNKTYNSMSEASRLLDINLSTLKGYMSGARKNITTLKYLENG